MHPEHMLLAAVLLAAVLAAVAQALIRFGFGRRVPVGDEVEYVNRAQALDPFSPSPFLRVPAMAILARLIGPVNTVERFRNVLAFISVLTTALVGSAGYLAWGPRGAFVSVSLFLFLPDRMLLSQHIWPDTLLALWHSAILLCLAWSLNVAPVPSWFYGLLVALIAMTRIDGVVLLPALSLLPLILHEEFLPGMPGLWAPTLIALSILTLMNARRYKIALPDTTFLFNVSILAEERLQPEDKSMSVENTTLSIWRRWAQQSHPDRMIAARRATAVIFRQPIQWLQGIALRVWHMLGPDTFGIRILLHPVTGAYRGMVPGLRLALLRGLRVSFPLLAAAALSGAAVSGTAAVCLIPGLAAFGVACLFQARTRFRYAALPSFSFAATAAILNLFNPLTRWTVIPAFLVAALLFLRSPGRPE